MLRDLTHQYRAVYDHLTKGATSLCPEGSIDLLEGLRSEKLPEGKDSASGEEGPQGEPPASETASPARRSVAARFRRAVLGRPRPHCEDDRCA
jgi:uncharacterized membrane-anchored protein YhcB (DUF1043 family)